MLSFHVKDLNLECNFEIVGKVGESLVNQAQLLRLKLQLKWEAAELGIRGIWISLNSVASRGNGNIIWVSGMTLVLTLGAHLWS